MDGPRPSLILGAPGIGKSNLTLCALHDPRVAERFGERRVFVRCEGLGSRKLVLDQLAIELGVEPGDALESRVLAKLRKAPCAVALDNAEVPLEGDGAAVEELISYLAGVPGLALVVSKQGVDRPGGVAWQEPFELDRLDRGAARSIFLGIAGSGFRADADLEPLLDELDGLPLAIELLAHQAHGETTLAACAVAGGKSALACSGARTARGAPRAWPSRSRSRSRAGR